MRADEDGTSVGVGLVDEDDARGQTDDSRCDDLSPFPALYLSLGRGLFPGSLSVQIHYFFCGAVPGREVVAAVGDHPWVGPVPCLVLGPKYRGQDDASCLYPFSLFLSAFPFRSIPSPSPSVPFLSHAHSGPSLYGLSRAVSPSCYYDHENPGEQKEVGVDAQVMNQSSSAAQSGVRQRET